MQEWHSLPWRPVETILHVISWRSDYNCIISVVIRTLAKRSLVFTKPRSVYFTILTATMKQSKGRMQSQPRGRFFLPILQTAITQCAWVLWINVIHPGAWGGGILVKNATRTMTNPVRSAFSFCGHAKVKLNCPWMGAWMWAIVETQ